MKLFKSSLFLVVFLLTTLCISAQSAQDSLAIEETALNYIEGYFYKDAARMEKALHPELVKRSIQRSNGYEFIVNRGASFMIMAAANNTNRHAANPEEPIVSVVEIYDIVGNAATVKVSTNQYDFIDYLHIGKYNNEWKIINVFWASPPAEEK
jgi:hypothetical protein